MKDEGQWTAILERDFVPACGLLLTRDILQRTGGFDERFFMYYEDLDFCQRIREMGQKIGVLPAAKMWHKVSLSSGGSDSPNERYWMARSSVLYFRKHAKLWQWPLILFWRTGSALRTTWRLGSTGRGEALRAYWRGSVARGEGTAVMTRLLMLLYNRVGRGTYWRALGLAKELIRWHDFEVTLLAVTTGHKWGFSERQVDGVKVVESPDLLPRSGYDLWDALNRVAWVRRRPFDLIHAFENRPVNIFPALALRRWQQIPLFSDWCDWFGRGGSVEQRSNPLLRTLLRPIETYFEEHFRPGMAGTTVINTILQQKALALGIPAERLLLLPNGADTETLRPQVRKAVRAKLGLPEDVLILGYTGTMFQEDGELMAAAFDEIHGRFPHTRLLLIGYGKIAVEDMVQERTAVLRTGPVTYQQLADYVAACDAGWLPLADNAANRGRFPMKVNDFLAAGRPLLVSDVGDLGDFVRQRAVGWAAKAEPSAMSELVCQQLAAADFDGVGRRARHIAETEFAWPVVAEKLANFYRSVRGQE